MKFEVIRKSHKKSIVIGVCLFIILGVVLIARFTFAKYELVKSIKIAEGTINYKVPDFKMLAMYKNDGNGDIEIETMPESGYAINETKSYCTLDNINKDTKAKLYTDLNGNHVISGLSKSSKCYLYFDNYKKVNTALGEITVKLSTPDFSKSSCSSGCEESTVGIYQAKDNDGWSYYYRGDVENNYVKFGKYSLDTPDIYVGESGDGSNSGLFVEYSSLESCQNASSYNANCTKISKAGKDMYWRIVRVNGDGSIRLIYDGTEARLNGSKFITDTACFAENNPNNAYVGFQYTLGQVHGLEIKSGMLKYLETWYTNNLSSYTSKIDVNAGFCGDRTPYLDSNGTTSGGGTGTTTTVYGGHIRLITNKTPILKCSDINDLYTTNSSSKGSKSLTYPIGLISVDEAAMAGGVSQKGNKSYYLSTGQWYWTMTPYSYGDGVVYGFFMAGAISAGRFGSKLGVRPVINLRSDTKFTGTGTMSNPYVVVN